jgi:hypothetical protein
VQPLELCHLPCLTSHNAYEATPPLLTPHGPVGVVGGAQAGHASFCSIGSVQRAPAARAPAPKSGAVSRMRERERERERESGAGGRTRQAQRRCERESALASHARFHQLMREAGAHGPLFGVSQSSGGAKRRGEKWERTMFAMVGLAPVKERVCGYRNSLEVNERRSAAGGRAERPGNLCIMGNPGARLGCRPKRDQPTEDTEPA